MNVPSTSPPDQAEANHFTDANVGLGHWPFRKLRTARPALLLRRLQALGIQRVLAVSNEILHFSPRAANDDLARVAARWRGRVAFAATINPALPGWRMDLEAALRGGAVAIRILPQYHAYSLNTPVLQELVDACNERRLPVLLPLRLGDERHQHPLYTAPPLGADQVIEWLKSTPVPHRLVVQNGRFDDLRKIGERVGEDVEVYFDLSFVNGPDGALEQLADLVSARRLLFGTQAPLQYPEPKVEQLLAAELSPAARRMIAWDNAERLFFPPPKEGAVP